MKVIALLCGLAILPVRVHADVTLPSLIADNMVLQRNVPMHLWGTGDPDETVTATLDGQMGRAVTRADGYWNISLKPHGTGGPYTLTVTGKNTLTVRNVLVGEVWVCSGQSNMAFPLALASTGAAAIAASANPQIRLFHIPLVQSDNPRDDVKASWVEANPKTTPGFSAVGYFFGRDLQKALGVPIGLIESDVGGTPGQFWTPQSALISDPVLKKTYVDSYAIALERYLVAIAEYRVAAQKARDAKLPAPYKPDAPWRYATLYNGMIAPLTRYPVAGALWYQGESNTDDPDGYRRLLPALIRSWRTAWGEPDLPFLLVQLAPYAAGHADGLAYAELREAQSETARTTPRTGLAVITDLGNAADIHPKNKEPVGARLALLARRIAYGENIVAQGPTLKRATRDGKHVLLEFENVGDGLTAQGGGLVGFTLAGPGGDPVAADARIVGRDRVIVSAVQVPSPAVVAYGFVNFPVVTLYNKNGLPATPFRLILSEQIPHRGYVK